MIATLAPYLDYGYHHPDATHQTIEKVCHDTLTYGFNSAFVNPCYVPYVKRLLGVKRRTGTVIAFPLGQETMGMKITSLTELLRIGADEFDVVLNIGTIKEQNWLDCLDEMKRLVGTVREFEEGKLIKLIPETGFLTTNEIQKVAELMVEAGADFFKTCSGYGPRGATLEDVRLIRATVGNQIRIKVAGGIVTREQAVAFIEAGANRIGTSHAVAIVTGAEPKNSTTSGRE